MGCPRLAVFLILQKDTVGSMGVGEEFGVCCSRCRRRSPAGRIRCRHFPGRSLRRQVGTSILASAFLGGFCALHRVLPIIDAWQCLEPSRMLSFVLSFATSCHRFAGAVVEEKGTREMPRARGRVNSCQ